MSDNPDLDAAIAEIRALSESDARDRAEAQRILRKAARKIRRLSYWRMARIADQLDGMAEDV